MTTSRITVTVLERETVRVNFNIPKALHTRLVEQMPTGIRTRVFNKLTEMLVMASERQGNIVFGAILDEKFRIEIDLPIHDPHNLLSSDA